MSDLESSLDLNNWAGSKNSVLSASGSDVAGAICQCSAQEELSALGRQCKSREENPQSRFSEFEKGLKDIPLSPSIQSNCPSRDHITALLPACLSNLQTCSVLQSLCMPMPTLAS